MLHGVDTWSEEQHLFEIESEEEEKHQHVQKIEENPAEIDPVSDLEVGIVVYGLSLWCHQIGNGDEKTGCSKISQKKMASFLATENEERCIYPKLDMEPGKERETVRNELHIHTPQKSVNAL